MSHFIHQALNNVPHLLKSKFKNQQSINSKKITFSPGGNYIGINLRNCDLEGINLRGADLRGADLRNTNLSQACLSFANLSQANLQNSLIANTRLIWTDLSYANLKGAKILGAQMMSTDLRHSNLDQAFLWHADLQDSNLYGCHLSKSKTCQINLNGAELESRDFGYATLNQRSLLNAASKNIRFENNRINVAHNFRNLEKAYGILLEEIYTLQKTVQKNQYSRGIKYHDYKDFLNIITAESNRFQSEINQKKIDLNKIMTSHSRLDTDEVLNECLQEELIDIIEGIKDIYQSIKAVYEAWKYLVQSISPLPY